MAGTNDNDDPFMRDDDDDDDSAEGELLVAVDWEELEWYESHLCKLEDILAENGALKEGNWDGQRSLLEHRFRLLDKSIDEKQSVTWGLTQAWEQIVSANDAVAFAVHTLERQRLGLKDHELRHRIHLVTALDRQRNALYDLELCCQREFCNREEEMEAFEKNIHCLQDDLHRLLETWKEGENWASVLDEIGSLECEPHDCHLTNEETTTVKCALVLRNDAVVMKRTVPFLKKILAENDSLREDKQWCEKKEKEVKELELEFDEVTCEYWRMVQQFRSLVVSTTRPFHAAYRNLVQTLTQSWNDSQIHQEECARLMNELDAVKADMEVLRQEETNNMERHETRMRAAREYKSRLEQHMTDIRCRMPKQGA